MRPPVARCLALFSVVGVSLLHPPTSSAAGADGAAHAGTAHTAPIPAFARLYKTPCSTCHIAAPKLNVLGEAFRLNGYRPVDNDLLVRQDEPISLGADPWKELWPRAIWPGELPGMVPVALRIQSDVRMTRDQDAPSAVSYEFPHEVYLLAGTPLGGDIAVFLEAEWAPDEGLGFEQARISFADPVPGLPHRLMDLTVGLVNPFLLTFTDDQIDRAAKVEFSWQQFGLSDVPLIGTGEEERRSDHSSVLGGGVAAVELSGLVGGRLHYGVGFAQAGAHAEGEANGIKDLYYRVRWKMGGLDYRGRYDTGGEPVLGTGGQLLDRSLALEHFGYFGDDAADREEVGRHRALGWAAHWLHGRADLGLGHVRRTFVRPFGLSGPDASARTWFAKGEYLLYPWLLASLKWDHMTLSIPSTARPPGFSAGPADRRVLAPGLVFLVRQNLRTVLEGEYVFGGDARAAAARRPHGLWIRMDLSF